MAENKQVNQLATYTTSALMLATGGAGGYSAGIVLGLDPKSCAALGVSLAAYKLLDSLGDGVRKHQGLGSKRRYTKAVMTHSIIPFWGKSKTVNIEMDSPIFHPTGDEEYFKPPYIGNYFNTPAIPHLAFRKRLNYAWLNKEYGKGLSDSFTHPKYWPEGLSLDYHKTLMAVLAEVQNNLTVSGMRVRLFEKYDNNWVKLLAHPHLIYEYCYRYEYA